MNERIILAIEHYNNNGCRDKFYEWLNSFIVRNNLAQTIERSVLSRNNDGIQHAHQQLLQNNLLSEFATNLMGLANEIENINNFDDLYNYIFELRIHGIGELTCYDITIRIAHFMRITTNNVYLQNGAKIGVGYILGMNVLPRYLPRNQFPIAFSNVNAIEIEDILCIYKDFFNGTIGIEETSCR